MSLDNVFAVFMLPIFAALSFVTMLFVKHGDVKPEQKGSLLEHLDTDD